MAIRILLGRKSAGGDNRTQFQGYWVLAIPGVPQWLKSNRPLHPMQAEAKFSLPQQQSVEGAVDAEQCRRRGVSRVYAGSLVALQFKES